MNDEINSYQEFCKKKDIKIRRELISFLTIQKSTGYVVSCNK